MNELNINPAADFGAYFSQMFYSRISDPAIFEPLHSLETYREAVEVYDAAYKTVFDQEHLPDKNAVQELLNALYRIQDFQAQYLYRLGLREGNTINSPAFLTAGLS